MTDREQGREVETSHEEVYSETPRQHRGEREVTYEVNEMGRGAGFLRGLSWGAVFAGSIVAVVSMIVLNLLGVAIGAATLNVGTNLEAFGVGSGIWWGLSVLLSLFFGGWIAGRLSNSLDRGEGMIHGLVTWGVVVLASVLTLTSAVGTMLGGAFSVLGNQVSAVLFQAEALTGLQSEFFLGTIPQETINEAQAQAVIAAEQAADALAMGAGWAFVALILGMLVAGFASLLGASGPAEPVVERSEKARRVLRPRHT